jgi:hypothetical protein
MWSRKPMSASGSSVPIVHVERAGIHFEEGFEIFRIFNGRGYRAQAVEGGWRLVGTAEVYASLNKLSRGICTGIENVWKYWRYVDEAGRYRLIARLGRL